MSISPARFYGRLVMKQFLGIYDQINPIVKEMRSMGFGYRYQNMRRDINEMLSWDRNQESLMGRAPGESTKWSDITESWGMPENRRYRVFAEITYRDPETREWTIRHASYYTNEMIDDEAQDEEMAEWLNLLQTKPITKEISFRRMGILHNANLPHLGISGGTPS